MSQSAPAAPRGLRSAVTQGSAPQQWLTTVARVALGIVLVAAGWLKISDPDEAVRAIQAYRLLPNSLAHVLGWGLPSVEILLGVLLVLGLGTRVAAVAAGILMVVFMVGIVSVWARGLSIDCGCFGGGGIVTSEGRALRYTVEILRDLLFLGLAAWIAVFPLSRLSLDGFLRAGAHPGGPFDDLPDDLPDDAVDEHEESQA